MYSILQHIKKHWTAHLTTVCTVNDNDIHIIMSCDRIPGPSFEHFLLFADGEGLPANYTCMQHNYALIKLFSMLWIVIPFLLSVAL
jgi:hypothetical protein